MKTSPHYRPRHEEGFTDDALVSTDLLGEGPATDPPASQSPGASWESIDGAPRDGRDIFVRWREDDDQGVMVRWKAGRRFSRGRWIAGGRWMPSESLQPLPAVEPIEYLRVIQETEDEMAA